MLALVSKTACGVVKDSQSGSILQNNTRISNYGFHPQ
jgi:hypothetical protein